MTVLDAAFVLYFGILWKLSGFIAMLLAVSTLFIVRQYTLGERETAIRSIRAAGLLLFVSLGALMPATYYLLGVSAGHSSASDGIAIFILFGISALAFVSIPLVIAFIGWRQKRDAATKNLDAKTF